MRPSRAGIEREERGLRRVLVCLAPVKDDDEASRVILFALVEHPLRLDLKDPRPRRLLSLREIFACRFRARSTKGEHGIVERQLESDSVVEALLELEVRPRRRDRGQHRAPLGERLVEVGLRVRRHADAALILRVVWLLVGNDRLLPAGPDWFVSLGSVGPSRIGRLLLRRFGTFFGRGLRAHLRAWVPYASPGKQRQHCEQALSPTPRCLVIHQPGRKLTQTLAGVKRFHASLPTDWQP